MSKKGAVVSCGKRVVKAVLILHVVNYLTAKFRLWLFEKANSATKYHCVSTLFIFILYIVDDSLLPSLCKIRMNLPSLVCLVVCNDPQSHQLVLHLFHPENIFESFNNYGTSLLSNLSFTKCIIIKSEFS